MSLQHTQIIHKSIMKEKSMEHQIVGSQQMMECVDSGHLWMQNDNAPMRETECSNIDDVLVPTSQRISCEVVWDCISPASRQNTGAATSSSTPCYQSGRATLKPERVKRGNCIRTPARKYRQASKLKKTGQNDKRARPSQDVNQVNQASAQVIEGKTMSRVLFFQHDLEASTVGSSLNLTPDQDIYKGLSIMNTTEVSDELQEMSPIDSLDDAVRYPMATGQDFIDVQGGKEIKKPDKLNQSFKCDNHESFGDDSFFNNSIVQSMQAIEEALYDKSRNKFFSPVSTADNSNSKVQLQSKTENLLQFSPNKKINMIKNDSTMPDFEKCTSKFCSTVELTPGISDTCEKSTPHKLNLKKNEYFTSKMASNTYQQPSTDKFSSLSNFQACSVLGTVASDSYSGLVNVRSGASSELVTVANGRANSEEINIRDIISSNQGLLLQKGMEKNLSQPKSCVPETVQDKCKNFHRDNNKDNMQIKISKSNVPIGSCITHSTEVLDDNDFFEENFEMDENLLNFISEVEADYIIQSQATTSSVGSRSLSST